MRDRAFEVIFHENNRMVSGYLYALVANWEEAVDLTQDTFITAYRKLDDFDPKKPVAPWLRGIARNLARNALRKKKRHREVLMDGTEIDDIYGLFDKGRGESLEERLGALERCIERLPEKQRNAVDLFYRSGRTARAIAVSLKVVENTVFHWLWLARKSLRECIESILGVEGNTSGA